MAKVCIKNFSPSVSKMSIHAFCKNFGDVISIDLLNEKEVLVTFRKKEEAINMTNFTGKRRFISDATFNLVMPQNTVFIDRVPKDTSIRKLRNFFSVFGDIIDIQVERNYFVFKTLKIKYEAEKSAEDCIKNVNRKMRLDEGDELLVAKYYDEQIYQDIVKLNDEADDRCVFIYNLPEDYSDKKLFEVFSAYGNIKSYRILSNNKAFINYDSTLSALKAVKYSDGLNIRDRKINVVIKSYKKKKIRIN